MILEQETLKKYGYTSNQLKIKSTQYVIVQCDYCGDIIDRKLASLAIQSRKTQKDTCFKKECRYSKMKESKNILNIKIGDKINNWFIISEPFVIKEHKYVRCQCDCFKKTIRDIAITKLLHGRTKSCGCKNNKRKIIEKEHFELYKRFRGMLGRCYNPNNIGFSKYGGKGVKICDEWLNDFSKFKEWSLANGYRKDLTIDRINPNKLERGYSPENCQWITRSENSKRVTQSRDEIINMQRQEIILLKEKNNKLKELLNSKE